MQDLIDKTIDRIHKWHKRWPRSVVFWSGGKDSTAMLHIIRYRCGIDVPVIQYREPKFRWRYEYSDKLIKAWDLEVYDYAPSKITISDGPDVDTGEVRFDILKHYQWGNRCAGISQGTTEPIPGQGYLCGVDDVLNRPTGSFNWIWGAVYVGTKTSDRDPIKGSVAPKIDIRYAEGSPVTLFPLRDWTDEHVFQYIEDNNIGIDTTQYSNINGKWARNPDKSLSTDYYPVCFNCINRHKEKYVYCPKLDGTITNISELVQYSDPVFEDLGLNPVDWNKKEQ